MVQGIEFEFGAKDTATATIDAMVANIVEQQKKLMASFKAAGIEVKGFDASVKSTASNDTKDLARRIGIGEVAQGFATARKHAEGLYRTLTSFVPALGAVAAGASVLGLGKMFTGWTTAAAELDRTAQGMGITVNRLDQTRNALRLTGASAEAATNGLSGLQQTMRGAIYGGDTQSYSLFKGLGIDIGNFTTGAKRSLDVVPQLANAVQRLYRAGNPDAAINLLSRVGLGPEWLTAMKDGAAGWERYQQAAAKAGVVTQEQADAARALQEEQTRLGLALEHFGYQVAGELAPDLIPVIRDMAKWVETNKDWLATSIVDGVRDLIGYLKGDGFSNTVKDVKAIATEVDHVVESLGGWKTLLEAIAAVWGGEKFLAILAALRGGKAGTGLPGAAGNWSFLAGPGKVALDAITGNAPTPSEDAFTRNNIGHGWLQDGLSWLWHAAGGAPGGGATPNISQAVSKEVPPEGRALLDAIAGGESQGDYNRVNPSSGAFGRYQFLESTWARIAAKTGRTARTPENQDYNAWTLAQEDYGRNSHGRSVLADMRAGRDPSGFLNPTWPSLPGGTQPNAMTVSFPDRLQMNLHRPEVVQQGQSSGQAGAPGATGDAGKDGTDRPDHEVLHNLNLTLHMGPNVPQGTTVVAENAGPSNLSVGGTKVETAMPGVFRPGEQSMPGWQRSGYGGGRNVVKDGY